MIHAFFAIPYLSEKLIMTAQQFKEQLQKTCGIDQVFVPE